MNLRVKGRQWAWRLRERSPVRVAWDRFLKAVSSVPPALSPYRAELARRDQVWLDVGACLGSESLPYAKRNRRIRVYAFEPDERNAGRLPTGMPNYRVIRSAVSMVDGTVSFHVNRLGATSSTKGLDRGAIAGWRGGEALEELASRDVPSVRLDTFLDQESIATVDYLKVDAQGADLDVVRSAGRRLRDILFVKAEAPVSGRGVYVGGHSEDELRGFMAEHGFACVDRTVQSYGQEADLLFHNVELGDLLGIPTPVAGRRGEQRASR